MTTSKQPSVGINISGTGAVISHQALSELGEQLVLLFQHGFDCHMDQETIRQAIDALTRAATTAAPGVAGTEISDSQFTMGA